MRIITQRSILAAAAIALAVFIAKHVRIPPDFAGKVHEILAPGATIIVTDAPAIRKSGRDFTILAG